MFSKSLSWTIERMILKKAKEKFGEQDFFPMYGFDDRQWYLIFWDKGQDKEREFKVIDVRNKKGKRSIDFKEYYADYLNAFEFEKRLNDQDLEEVAKED